MGNTSQHQMNTLRALQRIPSVTASSEQCSSCQASENLSLEAFVMNLGIMHDALEEQSELSRRHSKERFFFFFFTITVACRAP